ncbi:TRAP transporter substrate-binding protein [Planktotalea sp.]|uniref:TRAP transporter substrate-binding protein n=1 Tax=Planktotalea sp. TaxID=2029877 RepID=UPI003D6B1BBD
MTLLRRNLLKLTAAAALSLGASTTMSVAQDVTLRLHQFLPPQANVPKNIIIPWIEKIQEASNGRIKIDHFPAMQLGGKPPELIDQAIDGVADIVWTVSGYSAGRFPHTEVFELPFMMSDAEATSSAYWEMAQKYMVDGEFKDFHLLGAWVHGPGIIHSSDPIMTPEDLNGVKLRAPTRVTNLLFSGMGATAVGMPVPAVPEALSKGVIDATVIPWEVTGALKVPELVTNHLEFGDETLYTTTFLFAMNKAKYNALPDDLKAILDENSGAAFSAFAGKQMQIDDAPGRELALDLGNEVTTLSPEQVDVWRAAAAPTVDKWVEDMKAKGIDGVALIDEAKALIEKYSN